MTHYDFHNGVVNGTHRFQYCAASSRHGSIALRLLIDWTNRNEVPPQSRTESRQKVDRSKKSHQTMAGFSPNVYDDAIEVLLKFCGGAINVL